MKPNNRILAALPDEEWESLAPHLQPVALLYGGECLHLPHEPIADVYFIEAGIVSLVIVMADGSTCETGIIGSEGMVSDRAWVISNTYAESVVQVRGKALRLPVEIFRAEMARGGVLQQQILQFSYTLQTQIAYTLTAASLYNIRTRLARWLLLLADRLGSLNLPVTQELLAMMLGTRRASISLAASSLKTAGTINYSRGRIRIRDRQALEAMAGETYRLTREEYDRWLENIEVPSQETDSMSWEFGGRG